ncbi:unnamed protein product [Thlaspi arvense]|uniref:Defensin-like domain-containing protein n=1 Tax=Thlaspi arvense TaxID=13288 RepID=A0AAU9RRK5_THLAR|nr:unnamed protein product [Thlaspi arvense]
MGITKTPMACLLIVILTVSVSHYDVLALGGAETKTFTFNFDHCGRVCSDDYGRYECFTDCWVARYSDGDCLSRSPNDPKRCCCQTI